MLPLTPKLRRTLVVVGVLLSPVAFGQDPRGSIGGRVVDQSDAVVVGAKVQVTNVQTGVSAPVQTNESGTFMVPFLLPGTYRVIAEMSGFKTYSQDNIELRVADVLDLTLRLEVGNTSDKVNVTAGAPLLETGNSTPGTVVDERRVLELPQKGGDAFELTHYVPGVTNLSTLRTFKPDSPEGTSQISVDGTAADQSQWQIDGINDTVNDENKGYGRVAFIPPDGAIVEFKMQANPYDASAGHMLGPVISVNTKSGANQLHGTMYYWFKNSALDANDFFVNKAGQSKPVYQDHRYGLTIGGPVFVPRIYNGHNKTFFFFAWEENRYTSPATTNGQTSTVPTAAERTGDFSALLALGSQYQIYNPYTTEPVANGRYQRQPLPGNIIPKSLLNPVGLNLVNLYPLPNQPGTLDGQSNYYYPDPRIQRSDSYMGRADHSFSDNNRFFVRLNHYHYHIPKNLMGVPATTFVEDQINQGIALDDVAVLSPSLVLNIRYGLTAAEFPEQRGTEGTSLTALGFSPALASLFDPRLSTVPRVAASPFTTLSNWSLGDGNTSAVSHNLIADATKLAGSHSIRFGLDARLLRTFANRYPAAIAPDLSFSSTYTQGPLDNSPSAPVGQQLAAMLMGIPGGSVTAPATNSYAIQDKYLGLYIQDDFRLTPKLTLNLGLRYEMEWPVTERFNRLVAGFASTTPNPIAAQAIANYAQNPIPELPVSAFSVPGGLTYVNHSGNGSSPYRANRGEWLPRVGLAWQITPETVLRTGYGVYFGSLGVDSFSPVQTGFSQTTPIQASLDNGVTYVASLTNPFPNGLIPPSGAAGGLATALGQSLQFFNPNMKPPYSQRWSFGIQRTLPGQFLLDVSYIGDRVTHIATTQQINNTPAQYLSTSPFRDQPTINFLTAQFPNPFFGLNSVYGSSISRGTLLEPYPEFGTISVLEPTGYSWYHSVQMRLEKRLSQGYTVQVGYTHSKYMQATEFLNTIDTVPYRTLSDMDRPNVFTITGLWELPYGRSRHFGSNLPSPVNAILGNWQLDMTEVHQSGAPLAWGNIIFTGNIGNIQLPDSQQSVDRWFNTDAGFNRSSAQQLANNIRTFPLRFDGIRADGQTGWNFSLIRNYHMYERMAMQFRAEVYNALNHPVFAAPSTSPTSSAFGTVTSPASEPRGWQFALKLVY
ncbi:MAG TPA: TonB-dependent receptor [Bryobacteraceae bacterium]|nr:TonB-dependent receptor [Bryobacteraceae bacterium]